MIYAALGSPFKCDGQACRLDSFSVLADQIFESNVSSKIFRGSIPFLSRYATRHVRVPVFPEPAPAIRRMGPGTEPSRPRAAVRSVRQRNRYGSTPILGRVAPYIDETLAIADCGLATAETNRSQAYRANLRAKNRRRSADLSSYHHGALPSGRVENPLSQAQ